MTHSSKNPTSPWPNGEIMTVRKNHFLPTSTPYHRDPIQLVKAQGEYVWDNQGKRYLDGIGGIVCISAGHNHPKIKKALLKMLDEDAIQHTSLLYLSTPAAALAEKLVQESPSGLDRVSFTNSGSEANELALMAARNATGETPVVNLRHSYHGGTSGTLAQCGHSNWRFRSQPDGHATSAMEPYCYRCPFGKTSSNCSLECAKNVETTIQTSTHGRIAAFIAEPVMGVGGFISPPDEYFKTVVEIVHRYGGKYISDEVQTAAGRCGGEFLLTREMGIQADMITMAKGFGNGAAIGAVLMTSEVAEKMAGKAYFNTFAADPYQTLQAQLTMEIIQEEGLIANAKKMGALLKDGLLQLMKKYTLIGDVRGRGLLLGAELVKSRETKAHATEEALLFMDACKEHGLLLGKGGLKGNVIRIAPPLSIRQNQVHSMLEIMDQAFFEVSKK
jgi:4-aminobutyrate aminotransferase-like enzyme